MYSKIMTDNTKLNGDMKVVQPDKYLILFEYTLYACTVNSVCE